MLIAICPWDLVIGIWDFFGFYDMGIPKNPLPAKLVISLFSQEDGWISSTLEQLDKIFGKLDFISEKLPFIHTTYYEKEFGSNLFRRFISLEDLVEQEQLPFIKLKTNALEMEISGKEGKRQVNIDPGFLSLERFILATTKNYTHRIYLGKGIYGDLTLIYQGSTFRPLSWTYPDYRQERVIEIFNRLRERYKFQLRAKVA